MGSHTVPVSVAAWGFSCLCKVWEGQLGCVCFHGDDPSHFWVELKRPLGIYIWICVMWTVHYKYNTESEENLIRISTRLVCWASCKMLKGQECVHSTLLLSLRISKMGFKRSLVVMIWSTFTLPSQFSIKKEECIQLQYLKPVRKVVIQLVKPLQVNSKPISIPWVDTDFIPWLFAVHVYFSVKLPLLSNERSIG